MESGVRLRLAVGLVWAVSLAGWGAITGVTPAAGTLGTVVTIDGSGFGAGKPKVYLESGGVRIQTKVGAYGNTQIQVTVSKGAAGLYGVVVVPAGGVAEAWADAFAIREPAVAHLVPASGTPGGTFTVRGHFFGAKPTVLVGSVRAKWTAASDTEITVQVPTKLANGIYDVTVLNKVGSGTLAASFTLTGSTVGVPTKDYFRATFNGEVMEVKAGPLLTGSWSTAINQVSLVAADPPASLGGTVRTFNITALVDLEGPLPTLIDENPANPNEGLMTYQAVKLPGSIGGTPTTTTYLTRDVWEWTVTINAFAGGRVVGTFSGTMRDATNNAAVPVSGEFAITVVVAR